MEVTMGVCHVNVNVGAVTVFAVVMNEYGRGTRLGEERIWWDVFKYFFGQSPRGDGSWVQKNLRV